MTSAQKLAARIRPIPVGRPSTGTALQGPRLIQRQPSNSATAARPSQFNRVPRQVIVPKVNQRPFFQAVRPLPQKDLDRHHDIDSTRKRFLFDTDFDRHERGHFESGLPIKPFHDFYRSDWYRNRYRSWHLPHGSFVRPYSYRNHYYYNFGRLSYSPVIVYASTGGHDFDSRGFCTRHEHHHHFFESQSIYERHPAVILEYWWMDRSAQYDNIKYIVEISEINVSNIPLDYSDLVVEEQIGTIWSPIIAQPITTAMVSYRIGDRRLRFEVEVSGRRFFPSRHYRVYIRSIYRKSEVISVQPEFSNYSYIDLAENEDAPIVVPAAAVQADTVSAAPVESLNAALATYTTASLPEASVPEVTDNASAALPDTISAAPAEDVSVESPPDASSAEQAEDSAVEPADTDSVAPAEDASVVNDESSQGDDLQNEEEDVDWGTDFDDPILDGPDADLASESDTPAQD